MKTVNGVITGSCKDCANCDLENDCCKKYGNDPKKAVMACAADGFSSYKQKKRREDGAAELLEKLRAFVVETEQDADASDFAVVMATICEAAADEIDSLRKWVNDLQSGMYVNCVYCGHRYGPENKVPSSMADALKQHIERCPKHPMSQLRKELATAQEENEKLKARLRSPYGDDRTVDDDHFAIVEAHCTEIYAHNEYLATPIRRGTECASQAELNALREMQQLELRRQPITPVGPGCEWEKHETVL